jgi:hypothetical protein
MITLSSFHPFTCFSCPERTGYNDLPAVFTQGHMCRELKNEQAGIHGAAVGLLKETALLF